MTTQEIIGIGRAADAANNRNLKARNPELTNLIRAEVEAEFKDRIAALEAERDSWRKQALEEDARANAQATAADGVTDQPQVKRRGRKAKEK